MIDNYPDTLGAIYIHVNDPPWSTPWGNLRDSLYGATWVPNNVQDGLYEGWPINTYESKFLARQSEPTDVTIDMAVFGAADTWQVSATVCIEPSGNGKIMDVWMAQVLDNFGPAWYERNIAQDGLFDGVEISLAAGECATVTEPFVLNADSMASPENVKFFAWAQDTVWVWDPNFAPGIGGANAAEIYQGSKMLPPFEGIFRDGFELGDTLAWNISVP